MREEERKEEKKKGKGKRPEALENNEQGGLGIMVHDVVVSSIGRCIGHENDKLEG
jgi:hypothetical protein